MSQCARDIAYPRVAWPRSGWWFTVVGVLVGIALILWPDMSHLSLPQRCAAAVALTIAPGVWVGLAVIVRAILAFCRRAMAFKDLLDEESRLQERLVSTELALRTFLEERQKKNAYPIAYCYGYENRTFIVLRRKRGRSLREGQGITVVDTRTSCVIGHFNVTKQENEHYICEREGYMDALWLGNIRQHGSQHSEAPPEALAFAISETTGDDDE